MPNFYPMNSMSHQAIQGLHPCFCPSKVTFYTSPHCSHCSNHTGFLGVGELQLFLTLPRYYLPERATGPQQFLQNALKYMLKCYLRKDFAVSFNLLVKEEIKQALSWKQAPSWAGLWMLSYMPNVSMETTYQLEKQAPGRKSPRALHHLKEYPNYLCNQIESHILLCLLGNDHKPIDNCPLLTS